MFIFINCVKLQEVVPEKDLLTDFSLFQKHTAPSLKYVVIVISSSHFLCLTAQAYVRQGYIIFYTVHYFEYCPYFIFVGLCLFVLNSLPFLKNVFQNICFH